MIPSSEAREFAARIGEELLPIAPVLPEISLEQYYREAGPDYASWSPGFNMHFGYYCAGANPLRREAMSNR